MSKAHRAELYDDHMRDSNWKKLVGMGEVDSLIASLGMNQYFKHGYSSSNALKKVPKCLGRISETRATFRGLTYSLSEERIQDWKRQEKQASRHRGNALKIYEVQQEKGLESFIGTYGLNADPLMQCHHRLTSTEANQK